MRNQYTNRTAYLRLVKKKETASPVRDRQRIQAGADQSNTLASKLALPSRQLQLVVSTGTQQEWLKKIRQQILQKTYYVQAKEVAKGILRHGITHVCTPEHASIFPPPASPSAPTTLTKYASS